MFEPKKMSITMIVYFPFAYLNTLLVKDIVLNLLMNSALYFTLYWLLDAIYETTKETFFPSNNHDSHKANH